MDINVDKIKENIDKAAEFTVKKTGEILSITKLKIKKTEIKGKISDAYRELGETIYKNAKDWLRVLVGTYSLRTGNTTLKTRLCQRLNIFHKTDLT